jgi:uroporphyrin-III C-methyltransferase / precorrin-2 dehydrogenase / sirohydrochlorin ferrochelatase
MSLGKIIFIGAGPGDPDLLTIKAANYLKEADVVLTDRLVSEQILEQHVGRFAEIVYVGKECGESKSTSQKKINQLLVYHAYQGKLVVRLKGGDVSIFSNIYDELKTAKEFKVSYEIIPGITSALGAAAYAGLPLTARGYANSVRFLTYYKKEQKSEEYWKELAKTDDTLVFYMSGNNLSDLATELNRHKISDKKLITVIEQATTPYQKVFNYTFDEFRKENKKPEFVSPSLIIIGKVGALHHEFSWKNNSTETGNYFKTLAVEDKSAVNIKKKC